MLDPSDRIVRQFAALWLLFFGGLAVGQVASAATWPAPVLAVIAILGGAAGLVRPALLRPIYVGWMVLVFPLGWAISHLLLAMLFFGLITPLALVLRLAGRDELRRRRRLGQETYWVPRPATTDVARYYHPY